MTQDRARRSCSLRYAHFHGLLLANAAGSGSILGPQPGGRTQDSSRHADISVLMLRYRPYSLRSDSTGTTRAARHAGKARPKGRLAERLMLPEQTLQGTFSKCRTEGACLAEIVGGFRFRKPSKRVI
jgi:hypothetical protein